MNDIEKFIMTVTAAIRRGADSEEMDVTITHGPSNCYLPRTTAMYSYSNLGPELKRKIAYHEKELDELKTKLAKLEKI